MIARDIENALARYLTSEDSRTVGGLHLFKTKSGTGDALEIRTGHDDDGELPDSGFILCSCNDETVSQLTFGVDCYQATAHVELIYPGDDRTDDSATLPSFDSCCNEISHALGSEYLLRDLTNQGEGIVALGFSAGIQSSSSITSRTREASWSLPLLLSGTEKIV